MGLITLYVEKKQGFNVEAINLLQDFKTNLLIGNLDNVRILNKYTLECIEGLNWEGAFNKIFSEAPVDNVYKEDFPMEKEEVAFGVEYLPGQYDQRADSASQCFQLLSEGANIEVKSSKIIILKGDLTENQIKKIKSYYINLVDSREVEPKHKELFKDFKESNQVETLHSFIQMESNQLKSLHEKLGLAMSMEDLMLVRNYFISEKRNPTITEIKVLDTYWSDHCRHTTFLTSINNIEFQENKYTHVIRDSFQKYKDSREYVYGSHKKPISLMDIGTIAMKKLRKEGLLSDLDVSEEINACSIKVNVETEEGLEEYLIMFKNETHNHPTEIEPFGGAATCLGGAIRDPLSGRTYVYQAMRVTGCGNPTVSVKNTLKGKLSQRKITLGAAGGYSSYGNQIGLATGQVAEIYDEGYVAKRMEIGAVIAAAPKKNVVREEPKSGDVVILLGGKTGRDGCGGATGSSKEHTEESIEKCGAEVQKGNAPTERKLQRLFRNSKVSQMIKRCNDFGAGGVSVAIGELSSGVEINLDLVPKKYEGLDGTEIAISESQERMAVVVAKENEKEFIKLSLEENLEAVKVADITDENRMVMFWKDEKIVDLCRDFLDTNGAKQNVDVCVESPLEEGDYFKIKLKNEDSLEFQWIKTLKNLNVASQKGLVERFDATIGAGTVLMPFGGKYQLTPAEGMAAKIPVLNGESKQATLMTYGFNPKLGKWSPYHMGYYSLIEAVTKIVAMGGTYKNIRLTLQEYFEKLGKDPLKWGKPFSALLGAYRAQIELGIPAIGGKDSMSGTFGDLNVPPTLVAFAVAVENSENIISPEFKDINSKVIYIKVKRTEEQLLDMNQLKENFNRVHKLIKEKKILAAFSIKEGGLSEAVSKMSFGNKIGVKLNLNISKHMFFEANYGSMVVEINQKINLEKELQGLDYEVIGCTQESQEISACNAVFNINDLIEFWEDPLKEVFKIKTCSDKQSFEAEIKDLEYKKSPVIKCVKPKVLIPIFPGTNCEYDCEKAFLKEGAEVESLVFKNVNRQVLMESIEAMEKEIKSSQIIMLPGGFSAGDEPDGSGKFIATVFRNERVKEAILELLYKRDGLILGICNGFQALIKLGLLPYGEIMDITEHMPTLTYNSIGRHMSTMVRTKVVSKLSPWFSEVELGEVHTIPISHGEGRFVAEELVLNKLKENGQIATQYVDFEGKVALDMPFNPNGSILGIEGITSPDGRVLGKMAHSERIGSNLYKNVPGNFDQKIFKSGVKYFK